MEAIACLWPNPFKIKLMNLFVKIYYLQKTKSNMRFSQFLLASAEIVAKICNLVESMAELWL